MMTLRLFHYPRRMSTPKWRPLNSTTRVTTSVHCRRSSHPAAPPRRAPTTFLDKCGWSVRLRAVWTVYDPNGVYWRVSSLPDAFGPQSTPPPRPDILARFRRSQSRWWRRRTCEKGWGSGAARPTVELVFDEPTARTPRRGSRSSWIECDSDLSWYRTIQNV